MDYGVYRVENILIVRDSSGMNQVRYTSLRHPSGLVYSASRVLAQAVLQTL